MQGVVLAAGYTPVELIATRGRVGLFKVRSALPAADEASPAELELFVIDRLLIDQGELAALLAEYRRLQALKDGRSVRIREVAELDTHVLIAAEPQRGETLSELVARDGPLATPDFLVVAAAMAGALQALHENGLLHGFVTPQNVRDRPDAQAERSPQLGHLWCLQMQTLEQAGTSTSDAPLHERLRYLAPEMTGRVDRRIDRRADLYMLGATLYELLVGQPPFHGRDALELTYCHIARLPPYPLDVAGHVPPQLADMIMRLLAKDAEDRYQTAAGLLADLETCREYVGAHLRIRPFPLGTQDVPERLQFSERVHGREAELAQLIGGLERATAGARVAAVIGGPAGIGKTSLVRQVGAEVAKRQGYFGSGRYEPLTRNAPYSGLAQALREVLKQLLAEPETRLGALRQRILAELGINARLMVELVPELEVLTGPTPPVQQLGPGESANRFSLVLQRFVGALAGRVDSPLVLFLDDLQWADLSSYDFLGSLLADPMLTHALFVIAYRNEEVDGTHPMSVFLERLEQQAIDTQRLALSPLGEESLATYLADTLGASGRTRPLAQLVSRKTGGNPLFSQQLLRSMEEQKLLWFERGEGWQWDLPRAEQLATAANVTELLVTKLKDLAAGTREVLEVAACIGKAFRLETLAAAAEIPPSSAYEALRQALDESLVIGGKGLYRFHHDRIREAALSLVSEARKRHLHALIGRTLLAEDDDPGGTALFVVTDHLNHAAELLGPDERLGLARLNFKAARAAKSSGAFASAAEYARHALKQLPPDAWARLPELSLAIYKEGAECEFLACNIERAEKLFQVALEHAADAMGAAEMLATRSMLHSHRGDHAKSIDLAYDGLHRLGLDWTRRATRLRAIAHFLRAKHALAGQTRETLAELLPCKDPRFLLIGRLTEASGASAFFVDRPLLMYQTAHVMRLTLAHGYVPESPRAIGIFALLLAVGLKAYAQARELGEASLVLCERTGDPLKHRARFIYAALVQHWLEHVNKGVSHFRKGFLDAMDHGDFLYAGYCAGTHVKVQFYCGEPLSSVLELAHEYSRQMERIRHEDMGRTLRLTQRVLLCLQGRTEGPMSLNGGDFDEKAYLAHAIATKHQLSQFKYYDYRLFLSCVFNEHAQTEGLFAELDRHGEAMNGLYDSACSVYYRALSLAAIAQRSGERERRRIGRDLRKLVARLERWARQSPENYGNKHQLVAAELAQLRGRWDQAEQLYERSLSAAQTHHFLHEEALAWERAAAHQQKLGRARVAEVYLDEALERYERWGAHGKVAQLATQRRPRVGPAGATAASPSLTSAPKRHDPLDLGSVIKASQAISEQVLLDRLVERLMAVMLENAGARRGALMLIQGGEVIVRARAEPSHEPVAVNVPLSPGMDLCVAVVHYVWRTREALVLGDATRQGDFRQDPYLRAKALRSLLCMPIVRQSEAIGLLYLENDMLAHAFTPAHLETLRLLAAQAAISLENALLYQQLEARVAERTAELSTANQRLVGEIAQRERAEQILEDYAARLRQSNQELEEFAYIASHDLQDPLRKISKFSERLRTHYGAQLGERGQTYIEGMDVASKRMQALIRDLLAMSRVTTQARDPEPVELGRVVQEVLSDLEVRLSEAQGLIDVGDLPVVEADPLQMRQLFQNLLSNALKFRRPGVRPQIHVRASYLEALGPNPASWEIRVIDNGIGFDERHVERIFGAFQRLHGREDYEGTGIGLAVCRKIAQRCGGSITARSTPGAGSTFIVTLPVTREGSARAARSA